MQPDLEIWLDNHISPVIAKWLVESTGLNVKSSYTLQLFHLTDKEIYLKAKAAGNIIIISKDSDLDELVSLSGTPPKLIILKIGNCDNKVLFQILMENIPKALRLMNDFKKDIIEIKTDNP